MNSAERASKIRRLASAKAQAARWQAKLDAEPNASERQRGVWRHKLSVAVRTMEILRERLSGH